LRAKDNPTAPLFITAQDGARHVVMPMVVSSPSDNFCGECGGPFGEPAPGPITRPVATPYALAAYSPKNQERNLAQCLDASDVRGFHAWLKAGRLVRKGQHGIKIVARLWAVVTAPRRSSTRMCST
jgi:hypothetical protein